MKPIVLLVVWLVWSVGSANAIVTSDQFGSHVVTPGEASFGVNLDGVVSLLDVGPFVDLISLGQFQAEGDINQDGMVNLLDVDPFVALLGGG